MPPEVMEFAIKNLVREFLKKNPGNTTYTINDKPITSFISMPKETSEFHHTIRHGV